MLKIFGFQGEIPRIEQTMLPPTHAARASNLKLESGALKPYRVPKLAHTLTSNANTVFFDGSEWLSWNSEVDIVPGPVASDRLYFTGAGVPKVRVDGTTYDLAVPSPVAAPVTSRRSEREYLTIDGETMRLANDKVLNVTANAGWSADCSVTGSTASIRITHAGATPTQAQNLINGLRYVNLASPSFTALLPSLKIVRIKLIRDDGGQDYDANRNPIGSNTQTMEDVGTTIKVGGTTLDYTFAAADAQSSTDVDDQNDPPTFATTARSPSLAAVNAAPGLLLFQSTAISAIEAGQEIVRIDVEIEGLTNGSVDDDDAEKYLHVYTYVTSLDEESAPSPASRALLWSPGQTVRVAGFSTPPSGRAINRIRIYRSQTGDTGQTDLYLVGEIASNVTFFNDNLDEVPLQEPLDSQDYGPPPDTLEGLIAMQNGMMAGFVGKQVWFSEPFKPHAWPSKYMQVMNWRVVGLATLGASLAVLTVSQPSIAVGTHPSNMRFQRLEVDLPCVASRSIVDFGYYAAYASHRGLVVIDNQGARIVSEELYTPDQWRQLNFESFRCAQDAGRYVISHDKVSGEIPRSCILIDLTGKAPFVVRTSWQPIAFFYRRQIGQLYFLEEDHRRIMAFDAINGQYARLRWDSKVFVHPQPISYSRILVSAEALPVGNTGSPMTLAVRVYADGQLIATVGRANQVLTLPSGFMARKWQVSITGTHKVSAVYLAVSPEEIAKVAEL